jgi:hypothetical protein
MEKRQVVEELHRPARKKFLRRRTIVRGLRDLMQVDLMEFIPQARFNRGHKYVLVAIDCFSKRVWLMPLKTKTGQEVSVGMSTVLKRCITAPKNLQVDDGREFWNSHFKRLCAENKINMYSTFSVIKASIVERVIRTLKNLMYKEFSLRGKYNWIDLLDEISAKYNNNKHRTIGMTPLEADKKKHERHLLNTAYSNMKIQGHSHLNVNDYVRISKYKSIFAKGYTPNWSTELFKIVKIQVTNPVTYLLEDTFGEPVMGAFYELELQKAKYSDVYLVERILRRKGNKVYVKWLGLEPSHNSWVLKKDVL